MIYRPVSCCTELWKIQEDTWIFDANPLCEKVWAVRTDLWHGITAIGKKVAFVFYVLLQTIHQIEGGWGIWTEFYERDVIDAIHCPLA